MSHFPLVPNAPEPRQRVEPQGAGQACYSVRYSAALLPREMSPLMFWLSLSSSFCLLHLPCCCCCCRLSLAAGVLCCCCGLGRFFYVVVLGCVHGLMCLLLSPEFEAREGLLSSISTSTRLRCRGSVRRVATACERVPFISCMYIGSLTAL